MTAADHTPSPATDGLREAIATEFVDHDEEGWTTDDNDRPVYECQCGDRSPALDHDAIYPEDVEAAAGWHRRHLADAALRVLAAHPAPPSETATEDVECACESVVARVDYGTGIEYDVDRSSCPVHADDDDEVYSGCGCTTLCAMGPTCPGGMLAGLPGSGCHRTPSLSSVEETQP